MRLTGLVVVAYPFGGGSVPPVVVLPENLSRAVIAHYNAEGLVASVGPLYQVRGKENASPPMTIFTITAGGSVVKNDTSTYDEYRLTFRVRDKDGNEAVRKMGLVALAFRDRRFEWQTGWSSKTTQKARRSVAETKASPFGGLAYSEEIEYSLKVRGER